MSVATAQHDQEPDREHNREHDKAPDERRSGGLATHAPACQLRASQNAPAGVEWGLQSLPEKLATIREGVLQRLGRGSLLATDPHATAAAGLSGGGGALPHLDVIQGAFGRYDVSSVQAVVGGSAADACAALGAQAYAADGGVAFGSSPDLHTAAHEAAHVVQQRAGVSLYGGVGEPGDVYERHADAVADAVVAGRSAEPLLDSFTGGSGSGVQLKQAKPDQPRPDIWRSTVDRDPMGAFVQLDAAYDTASDAERSQLLPLMREALIRRLQQMQNILQRRRARFRARTKGSNNPDRVETVLTKLDLAWNELYGYEQTVALAPLGDPETALSMLRDLDSTASLAWGTRIQLIEGRAAEAMHDEVKTDFGDCAAEAASAVPGAAVSFIDGAGRALGGDAYEALFGDTLRDAAGEYMDAVGVDKELGQDINNAANVAGQLWGFVTGLIAGGKLSSKFVESVGRGRLLEYAETIRKVKSKADLVADLQKLERVTTLAMTVARKQKTVVKLAFKLADELPGLASREPVDVVRGLFEIVVVLIADDTAKEFVKKSWMGGANDVKEALESLVAAEKHQQGLERRRLDRRKKSSSARRKALAKAEAGLAPMLEALEAARTASGKGPVATRVGRIVVTELLAHLFKGTRRVIQGLAASLIDGTEPEKGLVAELTSSSALKGLAINTVAGLVDELVVAEHLTDDEVAREIIKQTLIRGLRELV